MQIPDFDVCKLEIKFVLWCHAIRSILKNRWLYMTHGFSLSLPPGQAVPSFEGGGQ